MAGPSGWSYHPCRRAERGPSKKALHAQAVALALAPGSRSLGIFNPRRVRGAGALSVHACGRAVDIAPPSHEAGDRLNHLLCWHYADELDLQLVIWNRQQWGGRRGPVTAPYYGINPHTDHLHIEVRP